jgi:hypothetical protein
MKAFKGFEAGQTKETRAAKPRACALINFHNFGLFPQPKTAFLKD